MSRIVFGGLVLAALLAGTIWAGAEGWGPLVIAREGEYKLIFRFGEPQVSRSLFEPGPSWRWPLIETVEVLDARLQYLNAEPFETLIRDGQRQFIDYFVIWRISDPVEFRRSFPPPRSMQAAESRIQKSVAGLVGAVAGRLSLAELLSRSPELDGIASDSSLRLAPRGVEIVEVRLNRTEIPKKSLPAAYEQMREQRRAIAREHRARGEGEARRVRAEAERAARATVADSRARAEITRGEGDAESARTYAAAYGRDPNFYAFVRTLEAYRKSLPSRTTLVLPPDHEFFRFLDEGAGSVGPGAGATPE